MIGRWLKQLADALPVEASASGHKCRIYRGAIRFKRRTRKALDGRILVIRATLLDAFRVDPFAEVPRFDAYAWAEDLDDELPDVVGDALDRRLAERLADVDEVPARYRPGGARYRPVGDRSDASSHPPPDAKPIKGDSSERP